MGDFLIWLSGASPQVLRRCPTERPKFLGIGAAILVTAGMAAVSMAFALYSAVKAPLPAAVIFALLWGLAIMSLDRLFVASMHRYRNWAYSLIMALPRLLMAVLLGFVISTPFVLQIFRPEINHQVALMHDKEQAAFDKNLPHNPVYLAVQQDEARLGQLENEAATGGPGIDPSTDKDLKSLNQQLAAATAKESAAFANLQCQLYGTALPGGRRCIQGNGPIAHDDQRRYDYWVSQVDSLNQQIQDRKSALNAESGKQRAAGKSHAAAQIPDAKATLRKAQQELSLLKSQTTGSINADSGLLTQLKGLSAATAGDASLWWARFLLFLVFLVIDIMPVFIKLLLNFAPESEYDKHLAAEEARQARAAENARAARLATERLADQAEVAGGRERLAALSASLPGMREEIIAARQRVEMEWLRRWEADQMRRVAEGQGITPADTGVGPAPGPDAWQRYPDAWQRPAPDGRDYPYPPRGADRAGNGESRTRPWERPQPRGLAGRALAWFRSGPFGLWPRRRQEEWWPWPTNGGASGDSLGGPSVP